MTFLGHVCVRSSNDPAPCTACPHVWASPYVQASVYILPNHWKTPYKITAILHANGRVCMGGRDVDLVRCMNPRRQNIDY
jgi:hypothetical protein